MNERASGLRILRGPLFQAGLPRGAIELVGIVGDHELGLAAGRRDIREQHDGVVEDRAELVEGLADTDGEDGWQAFGEGDVGGVL